MAVVAVGVLRCAIRGGGCCGWELVEPSELAVVVLGIFRCTI